MHDIIRRTRRRADLVRARHVCLVVLTALALAGCGAGGADLGQLTANAPGTPVVTAPAPLSITTQDLPSGQPGVPYPATALRATPDDPSLAWCVVDGALPEGLELTAEGTIVGTPVAAGVSAFTACATSAAGTATRTLALSVASFGLVALEGLQDGETTLDASVTIACAGATGAVRFEVVANGSGGSLGLVDEGTGRAVWRTGSLADTTDRLRATDLASGAQAELAFTVHRDPTAGFVAEFGSTDVWFVDTGRKLGTHAYATDFQAALVAAGLRQASSTSREGSRADRLAETNVRLAMLRHLSLFFLRGPDGSRDAGLPVSFPWAEPAAYVKPADGSWMAGGAGRYSVLSVVHGSQPGILGTAFTDGSANGNHENDTTRAGVGELGVFLNRFVETVNRAYNNLALVQSPLSDEDVPVLADLLHGRPTSHVRAPLLRNGIEALGRSLAAVAAHEIGHSLGLPHTTTYVTGALMNSTAVFSPDVELGFTAEEVARLRGALPGPGRASGVRKAGSVAALTLPEGGVTVCSGAGCESAGGEGHVCHLRLAPEPAEPAKPTACSGCCCGHATPRQR